jgi:hypothetical protein
MVYPKGGNPRNHPYIPSPLLERKAKEVGSVHSALPVGLAASFTLQKELDRTARGRYNSNKDVPCGTQS